MRDPASRGGRAARGARWKAAGGLLLLVALAGCACPDLRAWRTTPPAAEARRVALRAPPSPDPELEVLDPVPLLHLRGDAYQRGVQLGRATREKWPRMLGDMRSMALDELEDVVHSRTAARVLLREGSKVLAGRLANGNEFSRLERLPAEHRAYIQGIADGAGIETEDVLFTVVFVLFSDASCSAFTAFGPATPDGRLLQMRNLDWGNDDYRPQRYTLLLVHEPPTGQRWLSIGFLGLVGSLSGINESGISVSEIGAKSRYKTQRGLPMPLLLERVLAEAHTLDEAVAIMREAPGTGGFNFMIGSARERRAVAVEKTVGQCAVFEVGPGNYGDNPFFHGFAGFDCRADTAADPGVRRLQRCSRGEDGTPRGSGAYEKRYARQVELFEAWGRQIDLAKAFVLMREVAPKNNLHSILYDFERSRVYVGNRAWFRDRRGDLSHDERMRLRAAVQPFVTIDLRQVFR